MIARLRNAAKTGTVTIGSHKRISMETRLVCDFELGKLASVY
jgi:hypothetical protein